MGCDYPMLHKKKLLKVIDYLYTAKAYDDAMTHYMMDAIDDATLFELLRNPSLFMNIALYNQFTRKYFPQINTSSDIQRAGTPLHRTIIEQTIKQNMTTQEQRRQRIYKINYEQILRDSNRIRQNKQVPNTTTNNVRIHDIQNKTTRDLTEQHEKLINSQIDKLEKEFRELVEQDEPIIKGPNIKENKEIKKLRKEHNKQIARQNKRLAKNKDNRVKWMTERLKDKPHIYKVWNQTPNPKTRHTITDGQKVPLEEKFEVINDKTGQIDMMDYPGDWKGSPANTANCLCELSFTDDDSNVYDPKKKSVREEYLELQKKVDRLKEGFGERAIKLINDATFLGNDNDIKWVLKHLGVGYKERNRLRISDINKALDVRDLYIQEGYFESDFNLEKAYGKIYMEHVTSNINNLLFDSFSKKSNSHSYNILSKHLNSRRIDDDIKTRSPEAREALDFYSKADFYSLFNAWQRSNFSKKILEDELKRERRSLKKYDVDSLEKLFKKNYNILKDISIPLKQDIILYHGQGTVYPSDGEELKDKGVWNNTLSLGAFKQSGLKYANISGDEKVLFKVYVPKGTRVTPILQLSGKISNTVESELLLGRGHEYIVDHYYYDEGCATRDVRLIN